MTALLKPRDHRVDVLESVVAGHGLAQGRLEDDRLRLPSHGVWFA